MEKLTPKDIENILSLTPMQEGMLFHYLKDPRSNLYFEQLSLEISGSIDINLFEKAWNLVIHCNEMLRTVFRWEKLEKPSQVILKEYPCEIKFHDFSDIEVGQKKTALAEIKTKDREKGFDLTCVPFRVTYCKLAETQYEMIISNHHILYDGWSNGIILKEFFNAYRQLSKGETVSPPAKPQFKVFVKWIKQQDTEKQEKFWENYLQGLNTQTGETRLSTCKRKKTWETSNTSNKQFQFPAALENKLGTFIKSHNLTMASLLYTAWGILLQKCHDVNDIIFDATVSGRSNSAGIKGIENMVGLFINTLPLRIQTLPGETVSTFLSRTYHMLRQWSEFENSSILPVREMLDKCRQESLFDSVVVFENYPLDRLTAADTAPLSLHSFSISERTLYDLTVVITTIERIEFIITYNKGLFNEAIISRLFGQLVSIVEAMVIEPGKKIAAINIWGEDERENLLAHIHQVRESENERECNRELGMEMAYTAPRDELEEKLVDIWAEVLNVNKDMIGIDHNFFAFGGHSLKASLLVSVLQRTFEIKISAAEIFHRPTIKALSEYIRTAAKQDYSPIGPVEKKEYYSLSAAQKRMVALQQIEPDSIAYNVSECFLVETPGCDDAGVAVEWLKTFESAIKKIIQRHESLRTSFIFVNGEPVQRVHNELEFEIEKLDGRGDPPWSPDIIKNFIRPFDLSRTPLIRVGIINIEKTKHILVFDAHHIVFDGVSMNVFIKELTALYEGKELPALRIQYKDFSEWQKKQLCLAGIKTQENYWLNLFAGEVPALNLPTDYPRSQERITSTEGDKLYFTINSETREKLKAVEKKSGATLYMILLAAYYTVLMKYSGQEDTVVGTLTDGRPDIDLKSIIGVMITTLAMRNFPRGEMTFMQFLQEVKSNSLKAFENADYPFEELLKHIRLKQEATAAGNQVFNTMFLLQNFEWPEFSFAGLVLKPYRFKTNASTFEWRITAVERANEIEIEIQYATRLFKKETIEMFAAHYIKVLNEIGQYPQQPLGKMPLLSESEKQRILFEFNTPDVKNDEHKTVIQWFEEQVQKTPEAVALVAHETRETAETREKHEKNVHITYFELNNQSDRLANVLIEKGVIPDTIVGIMMERSLEMITGIYGILKSGAAYLPIDPEYPQERINYMLKDSGARILLMDEKEKEINCQLSIVNSQLSMSEPRASLHHSNHLIYVIYTSGTTGKPKGAGVYHGGFFNLIYWFVTEFGLNANDRNLLLTSLSFDLTQKNIFAPLVTGGSLILPAVDYFDPADILQTVVKRQVTWLNCTPGMIYKLIEYSQDEDLKKLFSLKYTFLGGEPLALKGMQKWIKSPYFNAIIVNTYGPTECTDICASFSVKEPRKFNEENVPTGRPIYNVQLYVLDRWFELSPIGVTGELFIGGTGVGPGYLNNPELTAIKFISVSSVSSVAKIYKTGDLARWMSDGNIEFLGRIDHQVKIRGFRIELGEIEGRLLTYAQIKEAVVLALNRADGAGHYLCAYFTAEKDLELRALKNYLATQLPGYMIPSYFMQIEKFPLTPHGKIDRRLLPMPVPDTEDTSREEIFDELLNETEKKLVKIWQEILGIEKIGIFDNFFELGGDSLLVIQAIARIREIFGVDLPVRKYFEHSNIKDLAKEIEMLEKDIVHIPKAPDGVLIPLSFSQEQLWFLQQLNNQNASYFVPRAIRIKGKLDVKLVERTFDEIISRHEILRTVFPTVDGHAVQKILDHSPFKLPVIDMEESKRDEEVEKWMAEEGRRLFDFEKGPMIRITLLKLQEEEHLLVLTEHHLVHDGWTQGVLLKEFIAIFNAFWEGKSSPLPPLPIQYKDYAWWQRNYLQGEVLEKQLAYWKEKLLGLEPLLELPTDRPRPPEISGNGEVIRLFLTKKLSDDLINFSRQKGVTLFMTMLGVFKVLLYRYTGTGDLCVGTGVANRRYKEMEGMLGMVINTLALRTEIYGELTFQECLQKIKTTCLEAYENEDTPFEKIVAELRPERSLSYTPVFQSIYSFMDTPADTLRLPGLELYVEEVHNRSAKFDINIIVEPPSEERLEETGGRIEIIWEYNTDIFDIETMERMIGHNTRLLEEVVQQPGISIVKLPMLGAEEIHRLLVEWNNTGADYPGDKTIHQLFEEQAKKTPDYIAISGSTVETLRATSLQYQYQITYRELNDQSDRWAGVLIEKGALPGTIVGIMMERSVEMIIGILGILKTGGAYMPIDPDYPHTRIYSMLSDSCSAMLLCQSGILKKHSFTMLQGLQGTCFNPYVTEPCEPVADMNALPFPDRSLINYEKYTNYIGQAMVKHSIALQGTRGCPYNCAYCHKIWSKKQIARSSENLYEEVKLYYDMGVRRFVFIDDIFNLDIKNSSEFFQKIIRNRLNLHLFFPNGLRGDILTRDYIDLMVEAGTINLALALETASPRLQKLIKKNLNLDKLQESLDYFQQKYPQVILELFTMHGFPTETEVEAFMTLDFIKRQKWLHFPYAHILKIYPNTHMAELAMACGISKEAIAASANLAYHELPSTLPFEKSFTLNYQADFLNNYFLCKERLLHVLPYQAKVLTQAELVEKYDSYLPADIDNFDELLKFSGLEKDQLNIEHFHDEAQASVPDLDKKIRNHFPIHKSNPDALRILFLDLSQYFNDEKQMLYDVVEPPLGLMYLLTYLYRQYGEKINGKIAKSRIDFNNYQELQVLLEDFKPDIIGIRSLTIFKDFFHHTISLIRQWRIDAPIIAGGPYASSDYKTLLQDKHINLAVLGEGEIIMSRLVKKILENGKMLPEEERLKEIPGIAFMPRSSIYGVRDVILIDRPPVYYLMPILISPANLISPRDVAYIIFTSGSTGKPKGIMVEHRNVVRLLFNNRFQFVFNERDVWTMFHSFCFDFSVWEMYGALLYGGNLVIVPKMVTRDTPDFLGLLNREAVTVLNQTPSAFNNLINEALNPHRLGKKLYIKYVIFGGEALNPSKLKDWQKKYPQIKLINMFGITETTVHVTYKEITNAEIALSTSNIGKPIPTLSLYILDRYLTPVPPGVTGELCVGGKGVCRGYLNRVELTEGKFIENPYKKGERLYRSGDVGRFLLNGDIEYLGRIDHQVKIRGFRIELGEIENRLLDYDGIKDAVVLAQEIDSDKYLCAYIVSCNEFTITQLRTYLAGKLPDYMIPSYFVRLEKIPLTPNGKIDRKALPGIHDNDVLCEEEAAAAPTTEIEEKLVELWATVLGVKPSINADFFTSGGDSIKAVRLVNLINTQLSTHLKIADIYLNGTIQKLALLIEKDKIHHNYTDEKLKEALAEIEELKKRVMNNPLFPEGVDDVYPMSDIQKGMVFHSLKDSELAIYHDQMVYQPIIKNFIHEIFTKAFMLMVEKHSILRTVFDLNTYEEPIQLIYRQVFHDIEYIDISHMEKEDQKNYLLDFLAEDRKKTFQFNIPPLWRLRTFNLGSDHLCVILVAHHAILDGWSVASLDTELINTYWQLLINPAFTPVKLKNSYKAFIIEQTIEKKKNEVADFWKRELDGYKRFELPKLSQSNDRQSIVKRYYYHLGHEILSKLKVVSKIHHITLKTLALGAYIYMLNMLSYENEIVTGLVTHNRPICEDGDKILGCFLNTIPLRIIIPGNISWLNYIKLVDEKFLKLKTYERMPLFEIVQIIGENTQNKNPIFDVIFNFVDFHVVDQIQQDYGKNQEGKLQVEEKVTTNTAFGSSVSITQGNFELIISYSESFFDEKAIKNLCSYFEGVLNKFITEPTGIANKIELLPVEERYQLLYEFNDTEVKYPKDKFIHELFEEQVEKKPDRIAVFGHGQTRTNTDRADLCVCPVRNVNLTYRQLNEKSDHLAGLLIEKGVLPDNIVGIMMERSVEMIIAIMGILKAGGAYLPIDQEYPQERIDYMLKDSNAAILLTNLELKRMDNCQCSIVNCQLSMEKQLAYIIYTSGSTGKPKGVLVEHRNVVNTVNWFVKTHKVGIDTHIIQLSDYTFDASVNQVFGALTAGAALYIAAKEVRTDIEKLRNYIIYHRINIINFVPTLLKELLCYSDKLENLHTVLSGAEKLDEMTKEMIISKGYRLVNQYGPTETTIDALAMECSAQKVSLGKPIFNVKVYILDKYQKVLPIGVLGELYIAGAGVTRGYLNNPELTREAFEKAPAGTDLPKLSFNYHPLLTTHQLPIYKTGDLARWLNDGNIEFLGRIDHQVKIRGFRIELREIENRLAKHPEIKDAVVINQEDSEGKYLCAYFISNEEIAISELRDFLAKELPAYMIPAYFIRLDKIPLTLNGKLDRKALPKPELQAGKCYIAPRNEIERKLIELWVQILGKDVQISQLQNSIGINDNFFHLGGHSLKATSLVARVYKEFNVKIPLKEFFQRSTIKEMAIFIKEARKEEFFAISPAEEKEYFPLSSAQKRLYFLQQLEPGNITYNMPYLIPLAENIDREKMEEIFKELIARHESLRTSFETINMEPVQRIHKRIAFSILQSDAKDKDTEEIIADLTVPFDLKQAPLLRVHYLTVASHPGRPCPRMLFIDMHHIITDGMSQNILAKEFALLCAGNPLVSLTLQYKDYSEWQRSAVRQEAIKEQETYWLKEFAGELPVLQLPSDFPRPIEQSSAGNVVTFKLNARETDALKAMIKENDVTLYMALLSAFTILLAKLSGQEDIIAGTPIAARQHPDLQTVIGMFVNTLAMRNNPSGEKTYKHYLQEVKLRTLEAYENQDYPFEELVEQLYVTRDIGRNPVFDVLFNLLNKTDHVNDENLLPVEPGKHRKRTAKFDMNWTVSEVGSELRINIEYATKLFKPASIDRFYYYFKNLVHKLPGEIELKIANIEILGEPEKKEILALSEGNIFPYNQNETIPGLFADQVNKNPDRIAIVGPGLTKGEEKKRRREEEKNCGVETLRATSLQYQYQITYRELNEHSNRLAGLLMEKGVHPDTIVAVKIERSVEMIIGILAILKTGGGYLPIDPEYPQERIDFMLKDSNARILINKSEIRNSKSETNTNDQNTNIPNKNFRTSFVLNLDHLNFDIVSNFDIRASNFPSSNLAYVIYTSGSTGKPKGVMLEQHNLINLLKFQFTYTNLNFSRVLQFTTISFDVSFQEIFSALLSGGQLFLIDKEIRTDIPALLKLIDKNDVKTLFLPVSFLKVIFQEEENLKLIPRCIEHIAAAGEQLVVSNNLKKYLKEQKVYLHNHYGPSETHVVTTLTINPLDEIGELPSIGKPLMNTGIYIMDKYGKRMPPGSAGEIWIGGEQVGRGYLNRPELTAERFKKHRSYKSNKTYISFYKTGDLGRLLPDGNIEFLGRIDHQVKIRGFRVEPGEIEKRLAGYPGIKEAVIVVQEDKNDKYLCAYVVPGKECNTLELRKLREFLGKELPDYMVPSYFMQLDKIPLTPSGKIDRKTLPKPRLEIDETYIEPRNETEKQLLEIWSNVLEIEKESISADANFFQLGGHSLKAILLLSKIHKSFEVNIPLKEIFKNSTLRELASYIKASVKEKYFSIEPIEKKEYYALSSAQKRLFILCEREATLTAYNLPTAMTITGKLDINRLKNVFHFLTARHESLRTSFEWQNGEPVQRIHEKVEIQIDYTDTWSQHVPDIAAMAKNFVRPFDLKQAPLLHLGIIRLEVEKYIIFFDMHHIISDGVSMGILVKEIVKLYQEEPLSPLAIQYKDFSEWQNNLFRKGKQKAMEDYWLNVFAGEIPVLNIPTDNPRPAVQSFTGSMTAFTIDQELTGKIKKLVNEENTTLVIGLLAIYIILLAKYSDQEDIIVGVPAAGRSHADLEGIIGLFVNTLPVRNFPLGEKKFRDFLGVVNINALNAYENQDYPLEQLVSKLKLTRDSSRNPLFDVLFVSENLGIPKIKIKELIFSPYHFEKSTTHIDIGFIIMEGNETLKIMLEYSTALFKPSTVDNMAQRYVEILKQVSANKEIKIGEIDIITEVEKKQLLSEFNDSNANFPTDKTIVELFEQQVDKNPEAIAVIGADRISLKYRQLNEKANRLARILRKKGISTDSIVGVMAERTLLLVVGIIAIWKAGGVYLPLSLFYPPNRKKFILEDSGTSVLLTQKNHYEKYKEVLREFPTENIVFLDDESLLKGEENGANPGMTIKPGHTAYLLFSDNTRRNGGILIEHLALINFFYSLQNIYGGNLGPRDRCLSLTDISLDISLCEIAFPLIFGATVVLLSEDKASIPEALAKTIVDKSIHFAFIPPVLLKEVCRSLRVYGARVVLDKLMSGGEFIEESILKEYLELNNKMQIITAYGPVETTIAATLYPFHFHPGRSLKTPAGKPLGNTGIFLLDRRQNLCPPGTYGELYISGPGLARGYLNRPELTAEKFIKNTFSTVSTAARMFKTGESGRWTEEGNLDFPVIIDNRVTIRGTHIEPGEIEDQLLEHKSIKHAVVLDREGDGKEKYLCAYIVFHPAETTGNPPTPSQLIEFLSLELPPYMIPQYFIQVDNIPRTPGGKVDRKALPEPHVNTILNYVAPQKETEKIIVELWKEVLGQDKIGINDNFFEIGGNSLGLIKVKHRIKETLGKEIADIKFLEYPTIGTFCAYLDLEILNKRSDFKEETRPVEIMEDIGHDKLRLRSKILENEDIY